MNKCTLVIKDQVNCKFLDLDPHLRRKISEAMKFFIPAARHMPAFKLGRWDGKVGFFSVAGATYVNMLDRVLPMVIDAGYEIDLIDHRPVYEFNFPEVRDDMFADRVWPEGHERAGQPIILRDYQTEALKTYVENLQSIQKISTGAGKAQPLWSKIKTPTGWTTMGEIRVGDFVSTPDGDSAKVLGLFPQGEKDYYKITFKDGRTAEACGDHLWTAYCVDWKHCNKRGKTPWKTLSTNDLRDHLARNSRPVRVPLIRHPKLIPGKFLIDPYVLGCILGDGGLSSSMITISTADQHIVDAINAKLDDRYRLYHKSNYDYVLRRTDEDRSEALTKPKGQRGKNNIYKDEIVRLGLNGKLSDTKFIPKEYLSFSNADQKLSLLRGLIDTDGYVGKNGDITFTTVSEQLAEDVMEMVRSLGGLARKRTKTPSYTYKGEKRQGKLAYDILIRYTEPRSLASLPRKLVRIPTVYQYADSLKAQIVSIEPVGKTECQCILIDHPDHLYITDNFVVTHNTLLTAAMSCVMEPYGRTIVIVPSKSLVEQTEEDYLNLGLDVGVFYGDRKEWNRTHTICTWQSLTVFSKKSKRDEVEIPLSAFLEGVVCVMVDETHSAKADELKDLLCGPMAHIPVRWGLTGTIPKEEFNYLSIMCSLGPSVGEILASDLQEKGVLANCNIDILQLIDDVEYPTYPEEHEFLLTDRTRLTWISEFIYAKAETGNTLVLVDRIETGEFLQEHIPDSVFVSGNVKTKDRKKEYTEVSTSDSKVIVATYGVAAVGINIPRIFNLILIEAGRSHVRVIQSIGRSLRKAHDKDSASIVDVCSTAKFSKRHVAERKKDYAEANYPFKVRKINYRLVDARSALLRDV
jgi:intein/homing endonuclease